MRCNLRFISKYYPDKILTCELDQDHIYSHFDKVYDVRWKEGTGELGHLKKYNCHDCILKNCKDNRHND